MTSSEDKKREDLDWLYRDERSKPSGQPGTGPDDGAGGQGQNWSQGAEPPRQRPQGPVPSGYGRRPEQPPLGQAPPQSARRVPAQATAVQRPVDPAAGAPHAGEQQYPAQQQYGQQQYGQQQYGQQSYPPGAAGGQPHGGGGVPGRPTGPTGAGGRGGSSGGGRTRNPRRPRPLRWVFGLLALYLAFMIAVPLWFLLGGNTFDATPQGERPPEQPGTALLLVGSDNRSDSGLNGARTDTIMILYVPPSGKPALISIPRDSYVTIPGRGKNKINAAYAFGGPKLLVQTIEQNTGLRMDGMLEVGMGEFPKLVDAVSGINVCLDKPMKDKDSKADFPAGCQDMDGKDALAYARMRKADPLGDLGRIKRQREVIGKVMAKALSPATLLPWRWWSLWSAGTSVVRRSSETGLGTLMTSGLALRKMGSANMYQGVVPVANTGASTPAGSAVLWNRTKAKAMFDQLASGSTENLDQYLR